MGVFANNEPKAIYYGNKNENKVSLMFNVYWGTEYLDRILNILDANKVKTTFFVGGTWVSQNAEYLTKIYEKGHEIGNHGYLHKNHSSLTAERNKYEIFTTHELVKKLVNVEMNLFAPPSGDFNNLTLETASKLGYQTIMWTHDTIDWRDKSQELVFLRATKKIVGGDLILMHPTKHTMDALADIISTLNTKKLTVTTVSNVIKLL
ncbi:MAG: polysaccharide deacetylase family protein [Clostridia bacterium]